MVTPQIRSDQPKALVLFGSASDSAYVEPIVASLEKAGLTPYLEYVSAHRNPARLEQVLASSSPELIVAGAGLAAHLPGLVASKVLAPVVGVPIDVNFRGLDALMSIVQMPPGVPVLALPMTAPRQLPKFLPDLFKRIAIVAAIARKTDERVKVCFVGEPKALEGELTNSARAILDYAGVAWSIDKKPAPGQVNIAAVAEGKVAASLKFPADSLPIFVPVFKQDKVRKTLSAITLLKNMEASKAVGLWCGANGFVNAACGALQVMNDARGRFNKLLTMVKKGEFRA